MSKKTHTYISKINGASLVWLSQKVLELLFLEKLLLKVYGSVWMLKIVIVDSMQLHLLSDPPISIIAGSSPKDTMMNQNIFSHSVLLLLTKYWNPWIVVLERKSFKGFIQFFPNHGLIMKPPFFSPWFSMVCFESWLRFFLYRFFFFCL